MSRIQEIDDPLGFTRETAALISGLGCSNLTKFKKKRISLEDLKYLTEQDLNILLDVGDNFDYESYKKLSASLRRKCDTQHKPRAIDVFQMLESGQRQLKVINIYLKYVYKQLASNNIDYFIEKNQNLRVSEAVVRASDSVLKQLKVLEETIDGMQSNKPKQKNNYVKYTLLIGGVGGVAALVYIFY